MVEWLAAGIGAAGYWLYRKLNDEQPPPQPPWQPPPNVVVTKKHECIFDLNNVEWSDDLLNKDTLIYRRTYAAYEKEFREIFGDIDFEHTGFEHGSVAINFVAKLRNKEEDMRAITTRTRNFPGISAPTIIEFSKSATGYQRMKALLSANRLEAYRQFCSSLKRKCSEIVDVAATKASDDDYDFVVITPTPEQTQQKAEAFLPDICDYPITYRDVVDEGKLVHDKIKEKRQRGDIDVLLPNVREALVKYGEELMDQHDNLNAVHYSPYKSVGFGTRHMNFKDEQCIVLYVNIKFPKQRVPVGEREFPRYIDGVPVDVREGYIIQLTHIGQQVVSNFVKKSASLGPILQFPNGSLGFLTSMHAVIAIKERWTFSIYKDKSKGIDVLKPYSCKDITSADGTGVGFVQECHYKKGKIGTEPGFEVGLVEFDPGREPRDAIMTVSQENGILHFNGAQYFTSIPDNHLSTQVFKYGATTGWTRGIFDTVGPNINRLKCRNEDNGIQICDQYGVLGIEGYPFARQGDSGAIVVLPYSGDKNDLRAVGIVTGQMTTGQYLVSPIAPILESFPGFELKKYAPEPMDTD